MFSNGSKEIHTMHNQVMATSNLFRKREERGQSPQNFWEQFTAIRQVCDQLEFQIWQSEQGAQAIIKKKESQDLQVSNWRKKQRGL